ncbi:hypothetical protein BJI67_11775 [Acidihalobacter aeolianus]|uniref:Permease n=1 Tax=Acidihalobacter aeolianus TaxID=2792603 RepID=A0A1D8K9M8_9GAMM|nr:permease [Acidihalobacter aeolianus]AOV17647.1 hypothetical protein BJI67_11775 [Acidihalobacter aeolianus]
MEQALQGLSLTAARYLWQFAEVAVLGFFFAGLLQAVIRPQALQSMVRGGVLRSNAVASVAGFATPLCCCTAIPTAVELYRATGRRGPASAFLIATPWFNWYALVALFVFLGWRFALSIALSAVLIALATGVAVDLLTGNGCPPASDPAKEDASCGCCAACGTEPAGETADDVPWFDFTHPAQKLRRALGTALDLLRELAPWILAGAVLGAVVKDFMPADWVSHFGAATGLFSLLALALIASVLYTDSLGSLPWIHALQSKGLASGNAMLLLVAGVGTNIATLGPVGRLMGRRAAVVYAAGVLASSLMLAGVLNFLDASF